MQRTFWNHRSTRLRRGLAGAAAAALLVAGCDSKPPFDPGTGQPKPTPTIGIALSAPSVAVTQGDTGAIHVTLTRGGGYTGGIDLVLEGAPSGVTGAFEPASVGGGATTSRLTLAAAGSQEVGTFSLTVRAKGHGVTEKTAALALTVSQAAPQQRFTLSLEPTDISIQQGNSAQVTVRATRHGGFDGPVDMVVTSHPPQLGVGVPSITGELGTITLATTTPGGTLAPGVYTVDLRAFTAAGGAEQTLTLTVRVTAPPAGTNVAWQFCEQETAPLWLAFQSEDGPWTRVGPTGNVYNFAVGTRGGVAWVAPGMTNGSYETNVVYGTAAELVMFGGQGCAFGRSGGKRLTGQVAGMTAGSFAQIQMGGAWVRTQPVSTSFTLASVASGPQDLIAARMFATFGNGDEASTTLDRFIIRRGLDLPHNSAIPVLDFSATEAFEPATGEVTLNGLGSEQAMVSLGYLTGAASSSPFRGMFGGYFMGLPSGAAKQTLPFVPAARQAAGDLHVMSVSSGDWTNQSNLSMRMQTSYFQAAGDRTVTLGPALSAPTVTVAATAPVVRMRTQLARQAEYGTMLWLSFSQNNRDLTITTTAGYVGGNAGGWDVAAPELSGAEGFNPAWGLRTGEQTQWSASAYGFSGSISQMFAPANGTTWQLAQRGGRLTP